MKLLSIFTISWSHYHPDTLGKLSDGEFNLLKLYFLFCSDVVIEEQLMLAIDLDFLQLISHLAMIPVFEVPMKTNCRLYALLRTTKKVGFAYES